MALFKPLIGDESRISLETTPWHEGYVYFVRDGFLYFDVNMGTKDEPIQQRVKLKADSETAKKLIELNNALNISLWIGTKEEYDAITEKDTDCLYITTDDNEEPTVELVSNKITVLDDTATHETYPSSLAVWNILSNLDQYEQVKNKVTTIDETATDDTYPTTKAVYDSCFTVANKVAEEAEKIANKVTTISDTSTDNTYPSSKATYTFVNDIITEKVDEVIPELEQKINDNTATLEQKIEDGLTNVVRTTEEATMQAKFVAQNNTDYTVAQTRNFIVMEHDPAVEDFEDGVICVVI